MTEQELKKYFNYLNEIYYEIYNSMLTDKITFIEWNKTKESIWQLKDILQKIKKHYTQTKSTDKNSKLD